MRDFIVVGHATSGALMLLAVDELVAVIPNGTDGCRLYMTRDHVYFDSSDSVSEITAKLMRIVADSDNND